MGLCFIGAPCIGLNIISIFDGTQNKITNPQRFSFGDTAYHYIVSYNYINPCPGNGFFATFAGNGGRGKLPPGQAYLEL